MPIFTFYLHEAAERVPSFEIGLFEDADAAVLEGQRLLKDRPRYTLVEITTEDQPVARVTRDQVDGFKVAFVSAP
jgi:hypothetical protein